MSTTSSDSQDRLLELLVAAELGELSTEEADELRELLALQGDPGPSPLGDLLVAFDQQFAEQGTDEELPADLKQRLSAQGRSLVAPSPLNLPDEAGRRSRGVVSPFFAMAAGLALVVGGSFAAWLQIQQFSQQGQVYRDQIVELERRVARNQTMLADARAAAASLETELDQTERVLSDERSALARAAQREIELAEQLAAATSSLEQAELRIARFEAPVDPRELDANRRKLLEVPGTVRLAWQPFDLPDAPAEQQGQVQGDVVWNDELQTGYLRFVNLDVNDPSIEQYQVWVIDERGMEQKVSGGVFNATADGEVIVPIDPGIDVGRVALFAVTVEEPGGTWVPNLERRIVVAPRADG